ncbi:hypothetical protein ACFZAM_31530 [Streptomyces sp. NPDC008079]|uniref:DUF7236 family protein n=1 Tax=Streptomyces sp. NPDC008079 TaxID=3364806 RepID=UPI0036EFB4D5
MNARIRYGVAADLEAEADRILRDSFLEHPDPVAKALILTPWMQITRARREVYTSDGAPDSAVRRGLFHRVLNPVHRHLNGVEGVAARPSRLQHQNGPDQ